MKDEVEMPIKHKRYRGFSCGFILIALGFILLLNNFNILPWEVWSFLWRLWPVFLVLWGLEILFGEAIAGEVILSLLTLGVVIFIIVQLVANYNGAFRNWMQKHLPWMPMYQQMFYNPQNNMNIFNNYENTYY